MISKGTNFFCLVDLPIPFISVRPSSVIPWNETVTVLCKGPPESYLYRLEILRNSEYRLVGEKMGFHKDEEVDFTIRSMDASSSGRYYCSYRTVSGWSEHSDALDLAVTGFYDKPTLSTDQDLGVRLGDTISFQCDSPLIPFDRFSLTKEGSVDLPLHQNGRDQGNFTLGPMTHNLSGSYRCFGWYNASPYLWSSPSNSLELVIIGKYIPPQICLLPMY
ncbi:immunoglobulin alpha Fc receptor-like [Rhynchocyon petersi]